MRVGVISDTHLARPDRVLPAAVFRAFEGVDRILHAGDLCVAEVLDQLARIAPVDAVAGNCDPGDLADRLGAAKILDIGGVRVGLTHGHLDPARGGGETEVRTLAWAVQQRVGVVVFGHSHWPVCDWRSGVLVLNPGSATQPRRAPWPSVAILSVDEEESGAAARIINLLERQ